MGDLILYSCIDSIYCRGKTVEVVSGCFTEPIKT